MAGALVGSEILKIAAEIRARRAAGATVCNLTVGDFDPAQFRIPAALEQHVVDALRAGETNYPPSAGLDPLRAAVSDFWRRRLGLEYDAAQVLVTGGSRPGIYGTYVTLVDAGDRVVYPVPSWNNNHYVHLVGAEGVPLACGPESGFLPTADAVAALVRDPRARLLAVNSPLNPAGTMFTADQLAELCDVVVAENRRRDRGDRRCTCSTTRSTGRSPSAARGTSTRCRCAPRCATTRCTSTASRRRSRPPACAWGGWRARRR
jgi:aspartate aminotransferase